MTEFKKTTRQAILLFLFSFISLHIFSQDLVKPTEVVNLPSTDAPKTSFQSFSIQWLKDLCAQRQQKGFTTVSFQIVGNAVIRGKKGLNIPSVKYDIAKLSRILDASLANNEPRLRYEITYMTTPEDVTRYAQNHEDLTKGELAVQGRPNLLFIVSSSIIKNGGGDAPAGLVGLDMGMICPPPPNCNSSDSLD